MEKDGYLPREGTVDARLAPGRIIASFFTLGIVALARSVYWYPEDSIADLKPASDPSAELAVINEDGTGRIEGQAFTKTVGGELRYAAGNKIGIRPATPYVLDALTFKSYRRAGVNVVTSNPDLDFLDRYVRTTIGDGDGRFVFERLPMGNYIITATVTWRAPGADRLVEQRVEVLGMAEVKGSDPVRVIVTDMPAPEFVD